MKKTDIRSLIITIASIALVFALASCSDALTQRQREEEANAMTQVYGDGVISVSAGAPISLDSGKADCDYYYLPVQIVNGDVSPIAFSGVLCVDVHTADGDLCPVDDIASGYALASDRIDGFAALDGYIPPGSDKRGYIFFAAPKGSSGFHISLASDFAAGEWIEFDIAA